MTWMSRPGPAQPQRLSGIVRSKSHNHTFAYMAAGQSGEPCTVCPVMNDAVRAKHNLFRVGDRLDSRLSPWCCTKPRGKQQSDGISSVTWPKTLALKPHSPFVAKATLGCANTNCNVQHQPQHRITSQRSTAAVLSAHPVSQVPDNTQCAFLLLLA